MSGGGMGFRLFVNLPPSSLIALCDVTMEGMGEGYVGLCFHLLVDFCRRLYTWYIGLVIGYFNVKF